MTPRSLNLSVQYGLPYPPEVRALLSRGLTYYRAGLRTTGRPPKTWFMSPEDYMLLTRLDSRSTPMEQFRLFGMRVQVDPSEEAQGTPEPVSWDEVVLWWQAWREAVNPLPPLEDLDEGLQCCNHVFATFADYLSHRRGHGEG